MRLAVLSLVVACGGCADLLGGLDEGRGRDATPTDADAATRSPACSSWAIDRERRVAVVVDNPGPTIEGLPLRFVLPTTRARREKAVASDGAELVVTRADGGTAVPFVVEPGFSDAATLWAKLDVPPGTTSLFVYYGGAARAPRSTLPVFEEGIVANATFDGGSAPWIATGPTGGGEVAYALPGGRASMTFTRAPSSVPSRAGLCQRIVLPPGREHRVVFDERTLSNDTAAALVTIGGLEGRTIWKQTGGGRRRSVESELVPAGESVLCVGAELFASGRPQSVVIEITNVRIRTAAAVEPTVRGVGDEERRCATRTP